jgi:hypothetical protein
MNEFLSPRDQTPLPTIGWCEWLALPMWGVDRVKVKVDTGARTSAIHAYHVERFRRDGKHVVRFVLHPRQRSKKFAVTAEAEVLEYRHVRSSNGQVTHRAVVVTEAVLGEHQWPIEVTLTNRDDMGFRMLLGRQAIRDRFVVDCAASYLQGIAFGSDRAS